MRRLLLVICLSLVIATPAHAGPPWLAVEFRANFPGVMLVRTIHHGAPNALPLTGTAEGLVNGVRRSVAMRFDRGEGPNEYIVPNTWGAEGVWLLNISATGDHLGAGVVVGLDRNGEPAFTRFPRTQVGASRPASAREADAMLRALDASAVPAALSRSGVSPLLQFVLVILILVALGVGILRVGARIVAWSRRRADGVANARVTPM